VPSVTVDPSLGSARAVLGQSPLASGLSSMVTIVIAPPGQTLPSASTTMLVSAVRVAPDLGYLEGKYYQ
jgi:hypothetical protein